MGEEEGGWITINNSIKQCELRERAADSFLSDCIRIKLN